MASEAARLVKLINVDLLPYIGQATPLAIVCQVAFPVGEKFEGDLINVTFNPGSTAVADAGDVAIEIEHVTTAAGTTTLLVDDLSIVAGVYPHDVPVSLWRGRQPCVAGDHIQISFETDGALTTPAVGASLTLEFEVTERSGS